MKAISKAFLSVCLASATALAADPGPAELPRNAEELYNRTAEWVRQNFTEEELQQLPRINQAQFVEFFQPIMDAMAAGDFEPMADIRDHAAHGLAWLRAQPWGGEYADWLEPRMDYFDIASEAARAWREQWERERAAELERREREAEAARSTGAPIVRRPTPTPEAVKLRIERNAVSTGVWDRKVAHSAGRQNLPAAAAKLVPLLKEAFRAEGVPPEWVWIAEVESSFNPDARSPVGARGLFQFMPATARRFGLSTFPFDERTHPEKSARAAARYLRVLHGRFKDWPLALAAYNAGEGRVGRLLEAEKARDFESIAARLPAETRFYVPKVIATVAAREQVDSQQLPAPR